MLESKTFINGITNKKKDSSRTSLNYFMDDLVATDIGTALYNFFPLDNIFSNKSSFSIPLEDISKLDNIESYDTRPFIKRLKERKKIKVSIPQKKSFSHGEIKALIKQHKT